MAPIHPRHLGGSQGTPRLRALRAHRTALRADRVGQRGKDRERAAFRGLGHTRLAWADELGALGALGALGIMAREPWETQLWTDVRTIMNPQFTIIFPWKSPPGPTPPPAARFVAHLVPSSPTGAVPGSDGRQVGHRSALGAVQGEARSLLGPLGNAERLLGRSRTDVHDRWACW